MAAILHSVPDSEQRSEGARTSSLEQVVLPAESKSTSSLDESHYITGMPGRKRDWLANMKTNPLRPTEFAHNRVF